MSQLDYKCGPPPPERVWAPCNTTAAAFKTTYNNQSVYQPLPHNPSPPPPEFKNESIAWPSNDCTLASLSTPDWLVEDFHSTNTKNHTVALRVTSRATQVVLHCRGNRPESVTEEVNLACGVGQSGSGSGDANLHPNPGNPYPHQVRVSTHTLSATGQPG